MPDNEISAAERESRLWKASREYMQGEIDASELEEVEQLYSLPSSEKQRTEDGIFNLLLEAIEFDSSKATIDAKNFNSISSWIASQSSQVIIAGASGLIPLPLSTLTIDIAFLLQKITQCCLGIGEIMGATVEGKIDIILILALWSDAIKKAELPTLMKHGVLVKSSVIRVVQQDGPAQTNNSDDALIKKLVKTFSKKISSKMNGMITTKAISGFLPVVGSLIGGGVNVYVIRDVARSAEIYYRFKIRS